MNIIQRKLRYKYLDVILVLTSSFDCPNILQVPPEEVHVLRVILTFGQSAKFRATFFQNLSISHPFVGIYRPVKYQVHHQKL